MLRRGKASPVAVEHLPRVTVAPSHGSEKPSSQSGSPSPAATATHTPEQKLWGRPVIRFQEAPRRSDALSSLGSPRGGKEAGLGFRQELPVLTLSPTREQPKGQPLPSGCGAMSSMRCCGAPGMRTQGEGSAARLPKPRALPACTPSEAVPGLQLQR